MSSALPGTARQGSSAWAQASRRRFEQRDRDDPEGCLWGSNIEQNKIDFIIVAVSCLINKSLATSKSMGAISQHDDTWAKTLSPSHT